MKTILRIMMVVIATICFSVNGMAQLPAFPGADGYAKYVTGGRGGKVYYVTRTDDCPDGALVEGTLRWALNSGDDSPRTILFATNGTIYLTSKLKMSHPNVSILGQSAPGGGVCLAGYPLNISKNNVIVRYVRFRAGDVPNTSLTGLSMENCQNVILDHCSMTWSMEECLTAYDNKYTTIQWCIIGEGLYNSKNSKGSRAYATQWGGEHSTMHHTLITNSHSRSPRFNGVRVYDDQAKAKGHDYQVDSEFANNVIYNWESYNSIYGGEMSGKFEDQYNRVYMVGNYYRPGPATKTGTSSKRYWVAASAGENSTGSVTGVGQWYLSGNKFELSSKWAPTSSIWSDAELQKVNADNLAGYGTSSSAMGYWSLSQTEQTKAKSIIDKSYYDAAKSEFEAESADDAFQKVTKQAGASLPRYDEVDTRILAEAAGTLDPQFTGSLNKKGIIDSPDNVKLQKHDTFVAEGVAQTNYPFLGMNDGDKYAIDSDADGMPDAYEDAKGLNKNDASDGAAVATNGYTNLENYLNGIADGTINKADYETSADLVVPGTNTVISGNFNISFSTTDADVEGNMPEASTVNHQTPLVLPAGTMFYKEGYSFVGWKNGSTTYSPSAAMNVREDMNFVAVFAKNTLNLEDRKSTKVTAVWDFTAADAPVLGAGNKGVYVTSASITTTTPATVIDARLKYDGQQLQVPSYKGATVTLAYTDGTVSEVTAEGDDALFSVSVDATKTLKTVTVVLPRVGIYRYMPKCEVGESEIFIPTLDNITKAKSWMSITEGATEIETTALDPAVDDGTSTTTVTTAQVSGVTTNVKKLTFNIIGVKNLRVFTTTTATNPKAMTQPVLSLEPSDGSAKTLVRGIAKASGISQVLATDLDPNMGYTVTAYCIFDDRGCYAVTAIKMQRGEVTIPIPDPDPDPDPDPKPEEHDIFDAYPYDAQVWNATDLLKAVEAAAGRADKDERYRIFLHNGDYDLGKVAKTAIVKNTSLIGESQDGVVLHNNPGTVTNYQEQTPVLYIDSEQNDVYMQDMTIRQDRDWETKTSKGQALALRQRGKRAIYKNVTMQGVQDTYYLNKADGSAYFENCSVAGEVDFIYGDGTIWFEQCNLQPVSSKACIVAPNTQPGYYGFVFNDCVIEPEPSVNASAVAGYKLGRPWGESPAATYLGTTMKVQPAAAGWGSMEPNLTVRFHEYGSKDAGGNALNLSSRSIAGLSATAGSDNPVLTATEAAEYTMDNVFAKVAEGWKPQTFSLQYEAPTLSQEDGILMWEYVTDAFAYAVCKDGAVVAFTSSNTFAVQESGSYTIRVANNMGGLGAKSNAVECTATGIANINVMPKHTMMMYNLAGQRVNVSAKGIVIVDGKKMVKR